MMSLVALLSVAYAALAFIWLESYIRPIIAGMLARRARAVCRSLALEIGTLERSRLAEFLQTTQRQRPYIHRITVYDPQGQIVGSTRGTGDPPALVPEDGGVSRCPEIYEASVPPGKSCPFKIQIGIKDPGGAELSAQRYALAVPLAATMLVGLSIAALMTRWITRPLEELTTVAERLGQADFTIRAPARGSDEVANLGRAFNRMADSLASAQAKLLERERERTDLVDRIIEAQEEERRSIALELHDHVGHSLLTFLIAIQAGAPLHTESGDQPRHAADCPRWRAQSCEGYPPSGCPDRGDVAAGTKPAPCPVRSQLAERIRTIVDDVRQLAGGMRPSALDDYGLEVALRRHIEEIAAHSGIAIDFEAAVPPGAARLPSRKAVTLFRVAQEAITNVIRHSGAAQASVILLRNEDDAILIIEDEGCGFDALVVRERSTALGLVGMKERMRLIGGELTVVTAPGQRTTIRAQVRVSEERTS